jgi:hypothetical protein
LEIGAGQRRIGGVHWIGMSVIRGLSLLGYRSVFSHEGRNVE